MVKDTVEAVRQAELKAEEIEKNAVHEGEKIIQTAHKDGNSLILTMTREALERADKALQEAEEKNKVCMESKIEEAYKEVELIKEMIKSKEEIAIKEVLSEIL